MTTRTLSSSSSSSSSSTSSLEVTETKTSGNIQQTGSQYPEQSSRASPRSSGATGTSRDDTSSTGFTSGTYVTDNTPASQQQIGGGEILTIRPSVLKQQLSDTSTSSTNQPIQVDVASAHQQYAQAQFANQLPGQQSFHELLGADAFKDVSLSIDYGAIEAYNVGMQSAGDITAEQASGNFDVVKAMFKQVDTNRDNAISRDEFQQWAQGGQQNVSGQSYSTYQTTSTNNGNNFNYAQSQGNIDPEIANILQQSGLGQGYENYR